MAWTIDGQTYTYRKLVTLTTQPSGNLTNYPQPVVFADSQIGSICKSDLTDIRFTSDNGYNLLYHQQYYGWVASGVAYGFFFVNVPTIFSGQTTYIWLYYGNSSQTAMSSANQQLAWDQYYQAVWHFTDQALGSPASASAFSNTESTVNGFSLNETGSLGAAAALPCGLYGVNLGLSGSSWFTSPSMPVGDNNSNVTIENWLNPNATYIQYNQNSFSSLTNYNMLINAVTAAVIFSGQICSFTEVGSGISGLNYVVGVNNNAYPAVYVNGAAVNGTTVPGAGVYTNGIVYLGNNDINATPYYGALYETRVSSIARSAAYISYTNNTLNNSTGLTSLGQQQVWNGNAGFLI
jgi:hypothetical protein